VEKKPGERMVILEVGGELEANWVAGNRVQNTTCRGAKNGSQGVRKKWTARTAFEKSGKGRRECYRDIKSPQGDN